MALIKLSSNYRQFFPRNYIARGWNGADNRRNFCCTGATCDPLLVQENIIRPFYVISQPARSDRKT